MKRTRSMMSFAAAALVVASIPLSTVAHAAPAAPAFEPGSAVASKPVYDAATGMYTWKCVYSGWALGEKDATCELYDPVLQVTSAKHSYTFDGSGYTTKLYYFTKVSGETFCVEAYAAYANGSGSNKSQACS